MDEFSDVDFETTDIDDSDSDFETLSLDDTAADAEMSDIDESGSDIETLDLEDGGCDTETLSLDDTGSDIETLDLEDGGNDLETLSFDDTVADAESSNIFDADSDTETLTLDDTQSNNEQTDIELSEAFGDDAEILTAPEVTDAIDTDDMNVDIYTQAGDEGIPNTDSDADFEQALFNNEVINATGLDEQEQNLLNYDMAEAAYADASPEANPDAGYYVDDEAETAGNNISPVYVDDQLMQYTDDESGDFSDADGPVKVLKRGPNDLPDAGNSDINQNSEDSEDDYQVQDLSEADIPDCLAEDLPDMQQEFLNDAFPEQQVSSEEIDLYNQSQADVAAQANDINAADVTDNGTLSMPDVQDDKYQADNTDQDLQLDEADVANDSGTTDVADTLGVADVQALSDMDNWLGDINPNFDEFDIESPYSNNCGSCAYAVFQRLEGSDPQACASEVNIPYNDDMEALTGMEQVSMSPEEIEQHLLEQGDGAHAIIGIDRAEGAGHWFNAACIDGKVVAIDGQSGEVLDWPPDYGDVVNWEMSVKRS